VGIRQHADQSEPLWLAMTSISDLGIAPIGGAARGITGNSACAELRDHSGRPAPEGDAARLVWRPHLTSALGSRQWPPDRFLVSPGIARDAADA
jgi:hypothetical protein